MWILRKDDKNLPSWLKDNLAENCDVCGAPKADFYNEDNRCTKTACSNPNCPSMLACKAVFMFKLLDVKGIGYATALTWFKSHPDCTNHVEAIKMVSTKIKVSVATFLRIHCLGGIDSQWETVCTKVGGANFDEFIKRYPDDGKYAPLLRENYKRLKADCDLFEFPTPVFETTNETQYITIMITGTPIGFASKEDFVAQLNKTMQGKIVILHQATKRQSNVDYLIREPGSTTRGKVEAAIKGGIPIVTSAEFISILEEKLRNILGLTNY